MPKEKHKRENVSDTTRRDATVDASAVMPPEYRVYQHQYQYQCQYQYHASGQTGST
jgi:hypothetical protein